LKLGEMDNWNISGICYDLIGLRTRQLLIGGNSVESTLDIKVVAWSILCGPAHMMGAIAA